uniref:IQ domain-containing protein M n=1 Tax=Ictidomys tridecemlineatus TaxID=43179 RepID=UPI001A9EE833|nr:IQ domain-containing protein M [Ictidomys tridecemlineatus]
MDSAETEPEKEKGPTSEIIQQDFFQEAKTLIAEHYQRINENKIRGPSINVFRNKHQKLKSSKYIPLKIKKTESFDMVQEHRTALRSIGFSKELSKSETLEEPSIPQTSSQEPHVSKMKEKYQCIDLFTKEPVKLHKIMIDIEPVSKKMEKEKQQQPGKSRTVDFLEAFPILPGLSIPPKISSSTGLEKEPGKNEAAIKERDRSEDFLLLWGCFLALGTSLQGHLRERRDAASLFPACHVHILEALKKTSMKKEQKPIILEPKPGPRVKVVKKDDKLENKVKRIGPHIEIFQVFQVKSKLFITKNIIDMVTLMQAHVRGWLERKRFQRLMSKALYHGPNLKEVINMYRGLIHRVRCRLGLRRTRQIINFPELEEWMDRKKYYETKFSKREDWQGLERSDLLKYFRDCGHYPTQKQVDEYWDLFNKDKSLTHPEVIKRAHAIELLFMLYPPKGAHVGNKGRLKSTWLRPIVNGEEGYKYIVNRHPILRRANIQIVGKLVARSIRERKMRAYFESREV